MFLPFLETRLMPPLNKLANLRFIRAIMQAGIITVPFTIVGSIFLIINNLPQIIPPLASFFEQTILRFSPLYSVVTTMSVGSIAVFYCLATGYYLTEIYHKEEHLTMSSFVGALLSLFAFFNDDHSSRYHRWYCTIATIRKRNRHCLQWGRFRRLDHSLQWSRDLHRDYHRSNCYVSLSFCVKERSPSRCLKEFLMESAKHLRH